MIFYLAQKYSLCHPSIVFSSMYSTYAMLLFPHSLRDRLTEKYAKVSGLQVVRKRKYEEYGHFKANMMERLKQIYDKRREPDDDEPRRESEDTQDEGVDELRDLYFQYKNEKVI